MANIIFPSGVTEKNPAVNNDFLPIADSADSNNLKKVKVLNLGLRQEPVFQFLDAGVTTTVNLPAIATAGVEYIIKKTDASYTAITINANGTDKIEHPFTPVATPAESSIKLQIPGDTVHLYSDGTHWRILDYITTNDIGFRAYIPSNVGGLSGTVTVPYSSEKYDHGGYYDNSTYTFTPLVKGVYYVEASILFNGSYTNMALDLRVAASNTKRVMQSSTTLNNFGGSGGAFMEFNGTTDNFLVQVQALGTYTIYGDATGVFSSLSASLIRRT